MSAASVWDEAAAMVASNNNNNGNGNGAPIARTGMPPRNNSTVTDDDDGGSSVPRRERVLLGPEEMATLSLSSRNVAMRKDLTLTGGSNGSTTPKSTGASQRGLLSASGHGHGHADGNSSVVHVMTATSASNPSTTTTIGPPTGSGTGTTATRSGKLSADDRTGYVRIYYKNQDTTASIAVKVAATTTVLEVRKSVANKMNIDPADFSYYVIVVVFPGDTAHSVSARTLQDEETILPLMEKFSRSRPIPSDGEDALAGLRTKTAKHRPRSTLRFILKDVRVAKLDIDDERNNKEPTEVQGISVPAFLGKGVRSGYLQKASLKDPNIWRRRWFVVKGDQLLYCKSETNQRDVTAISLLKRTYIGKARPDVRVPFAFELVTPSRSYQLAASSKEDMLAWMDALHVQIEIAPENHLLYEAEIIITEAQVERSEEDMATSSKEPSLLQRVLSREDTNKCFRDFAYNNGSQPLLDTWIQCDIFRRNCLEREADAAMHRENRLTAKEEWDHLRAIVRDAAGLPMINQDEVRHLVQYLETDQINRRLSIALHSDGFAEYPHVDLVSNLRQQIFKAIETGPFRQFLMGRGYRVLLERVVGRIA